MMAPQGSAEWLAARAGCLTASAIADMIAKTKTGEAAASRANLRARLVAERLTGVPQDSFSNAAMQWGNEQEPFARAAYEIKSGNLVDQTGIVMEVETTLEGVQLYTGNFISDRAGKNGARYASYGGFCLETQHYPDAVNQPAFPSPVLHQGEPLHETTIYRFRVRK